MKSKQIDFVKDKSERREKSKEEKKEIDKAISIPNEKKFFEIVSSIPKEKSETGKSKGKTTEVKTPGISETTTSSQEDLDFEELITDRRSLEEVLGVSATSPNSTSSDLSEAEKEETNNFGKLYERTDKPEKREDLYTSQRSQPQESQRDLYSPREVTTGEVRESHIREREMVDSTPDEFIRKMRELYLHKSA